MINVFRIFLSFLYFGIVVVPSLFIVVCAWLWWQSAKDLWIIPVLATVFLVPWSIAQTVELVKDLREDLRIWRVSRLLRRDG